MTKPAATHARGVRKRQKHRWGDWTPTLNTELREKVQVHNLVKTLSERMKTGGRIKHGITGLDDDGYRTLRPVQAMQYLIC